LLIIIRLKVQTNLQSPQKEAESVPEEEEGNTILKKRKLTDNEY
jgi:hypothetical protein